MNNIDNANLWSVWVGGGEVNDCPVTMNDWTWAEMEIQ